MPFTFSHPIYAVPIKYISPKNISLTGIILGSMAPDFEYFIALEPYQTIGHTTKGLFLQGIPLSILFAYVFHYIIKVSLIAHLPKWYDADLKYYELIKSWNLNSVRQWIVFVSSIIIGFYTHVFLDAFTHQGGWFVYHIAILTEQIMGVPIYKLLQHSFSLAGLFIPMFFLIRYLKTSRTSDLKLRKSTRTKIVYWLSVCVVILLTLTLKFSFSTSSNMIGMFIVSSITGTFVGVTVASLIFWRIR